MHELPITESILKIVLRHAEGQRVRKVVAIHLQIGRLSDLEDEWIQRYFDYLSKGTIAEGARLKIERTPVMMQCNACRTSYEVEAARIGDLVCPACGEGSGTLLSGREYYIKEMEVQ
ncbi:MAG: hydrogenase maturation nickel metallochaperone HypA [Deltaproteobacteria bacterium]|nr:hydrogenase maturation nickel metallochaperone HypA [Deltaproteobacteria bacterium]